MRNYAKKMGTGSTKTKKRLVKTITDINLYLTESGFAPVFTETTPEAGDII